MARRHFAKGLVAQTDVPLDLWMDELRKNGESVIPANQVNRIAKTVLRKADPKQFLLSHATIVASVDAYAPKDVKLGKQFIRGVQIDVKYPEYRLKPETHSIINNNGDCWSRPLLLSTYRTFIGAQHYLEHIQLPELSKGFIVDAIARDIGHSVYIDILVATDKKHDMLVGDILSGKLNALSMGCTSQFTICTKCGNVAYDDASLCPCITVDGKGSIFMDDDGHEHPVAELIGHVSVPNSNVFIEASWVHTPAFTGAVRRNVLNEDESKLAAMMEAATVVNAEKKSPGFGGVRKKASEIFKISADEPATDNAPSDAGSADAPIPSTGDSKDPLDALSNLFGDSSDSSSKEPSPVGAEPAATTEGEPAEAADAKPDGEGATGEVKPDKLDRVVGKIEDSIIDAVIKKIEDRFNPKPEDVGSVMITAPSVESQNDNLVTASMVAQAILNDDVFASDLKSIADRVLTSSRRMASSSERLKDVTHRDMLILLWAIDKRKGREYPTSLYKVAMKVGSMAQYPSRTAFLASVKMQLGRALTPSDVAFFMEKSELTSVAGF